VFRKARVRIWQGIALEPQLAGGDERLQARAMVTRALRELANDLTEWTDQYANAGLLVTAEQRDALQAIFDA
jgi:hypothetical protein